MSLTSEILHIQPVFHDEAVEIPTRNARTLGGRRDIATRLAEKSGDRIALEAGDGPTLRFDKALAALPSVSGLVPGREGSMGAGGRPEGEFEAGGPLEESRRNNRFMGQPRG